jgi:hypothetical protein
VFVLFVTAERAKEAALAADNHRRKVDGKEGQSLFSFFFTSRFNTESLIFFFSLFLQSGKGTAPLVKRVR